MYLTRKTRRGQVLVLACVTMLLMALMLMISINLASAIHEKIGLQAAADAQAFSGATLEARAFNTAAYQNRAIAGLLVAEMGLHAWWAIAQHDVNLIKAGFAPFMEIAVMEFAQCPPYFFQHCVHGFQALKIAFDYMRTGNSLQDDLDNLKDPFDKAVGNLSKAIKGIHGDQNSFLSDTKTEISSYSATMGTLKRTNAPKAGYATALDTMNRKAFGCALEGTTAADGCDTTEKTGNELGEIMNSAAMAARPEFERGKSGSLTLVPGDFNMESLPFPLPIDIKYNPGKPMDIQSSGTYLFIPTGNDVKGTIENATGTVKGEAPGGVVFAQWNDGIGFGYASEGKQTTSQGERDYEGAVCDDKSTNCFVNFRGSSDADKDFNQPTMYGGLTQNLRSLREGGSTKPWEINSTGTVSVDIGGGQQLKVKVIPRNGGTGVAVAKAKTYFHQMGQWKQPPNMFDPFWHAKLHPFKRSELATVLNAVGDTEGARLSQNAAVEGRDR